MEAAKAGLNLHLLISTLLEITCRGSNRIYIFLHSDVYGSQTNICSSLTHTVGNKTNSVPVIFESMKLF